MGFYRFLPKPVGVLALSGVAGVKHTSVRVFKQDSAYKEVRSLGDNIC